MSKKTAILILVAVILAAISLFLWLDQMPVTKIQIASRNVHVGKTSVTVFMIDSQEPITRIKVTSVEEARTNDHPHALWELIPDNKPIKKSEFAYGENIPGMKPFIPGTKPEALEPDSKYFLVVNLGKTLRGECVFDAPGTAQH